MVPFKMAEKWSVISWKQLNSSSNYFGRVTVCCIVQGMVDCNSSHIQSSCTDSKSFSFQEFADVGIWSYVIPRPTERNGSAGGEERRSSDAGKEDAKKRRSCQEEELTEEDAAARRPSPRMRWSSGVARI
ncbi:hypothetical protein CDAR_26491 [Caerostris darwini]|uniref:Uncharacterized protein n=1 Tax=Caerostris darwini TaxID=1538125 RepID=A0AAV4QED3_9ARAC|nr:hypothetical protein CDAR_26491 [Caerostris darwini]